MINYQAENKVLLYKLERILNHIDNRLQLVDPITKNELKSIRNIVTTYETVPSDWSMSSKFADEYQLGTEKEN